MTSSFCNFPFYTRSLLFTISVSTPPTFALKASLSRAHSSSLVTQASQSPVHTLLQMHLPASLTHPWASACQTQIRSHLLRKASQTTVNLLTSSFHRGLRFHFLQQIIQPVMSQASSFNCHEYYCLSQKSRPYSLSHGPRGRPT